VRGGLVTGAALVEGAEQGCSCAAWLRRWEDERCGASHDVWRVTEQSEQRA
jgi:hypothetical protein